MVSASPLSVDTVSKSYGKQSVLESISFALREGEIFGLIGLNGAGKTTLIKIILNLAEADAGNVSVFDTPTHNVKARRNISYLPEKFQPSRYLKGREYLKLSLSYYGRKLEIEKARQCVANLDLDPDKLDAKVGAYSKGMGQKLGLAGAFLLDVPFLILDEPMSGLDPSARIKLKEQLMAIKKLGKTVFFSSHILSDIDEICDRIGIIHNGKMVFVGTPAEFKTQYPAPSLESAFLLSIKP